MQAVKRAGANMESGEGNLLSRLLNIGLGLFYPEVCQICEAERAGVQEGFVGAECAKKAIFVKPPFCSKCGGTFSGIITTDFVCSHCLELPPAFITARTAVVANAFMLDVIHRYKYGRALHFEPFLANLILHEARPALSAEPWDFIVPVPLHPVKQREREFNQAERLARCLGKGLGLPVKTRLLRRVEPTRSQTTLSRKDRAKNVQNAFAPGKTRLKGEKIILLDDVMTTGATTNACAKALLKAGAGKVCVWAVARGT